MKPARAAAAFCSLFFALLLLHASLLRLPYFWDEAGYYIPAARDFFLHHQLIPTSTLSNAHPPLPAIYLSIAWWIFGYAPLVTRVAMLLVAAFALVAVFRLARVLQNAEVAWATVAATALYPIWFAQSSLAHADLLAACFTLWGLAEYFAQRPSVIREQLRHDIVIPRSVATKDLAFPARGAQLRIVLLFTLAALAKETALLFPFTLALCEQFLRPRRKLTHSLALLFPALPLAAWFAYHRLRTGYFFGNPEFLRYNVQANTSPLRFLLAFVQRGWHLFGHMDLFVLTILAVVALAWPAVRDRDRARPRIAISAQLVIAALVVANWIAFSLVGGALLTRYLLPVYPLVILIFISTLWRRWRQWRVAVAVVSLAFISALLWNPGYRYAPEDNLAYADYIRLHQHACEFIESRLPHAIVLTAWTGSDELSKPYLGYVARPVPVVAIDDFTLPQITAAAQQAGAYDAAFVFSTKYDPPNTLLKRLRFWERRNEQYFGYHSDLPPEAIAQLLGGHIVWQQRHGALWAAVIVFDRSFVG